MSVIVDALWLEVLRYAYVLSGVPWPEWLAGGMLAGVVVAAWRLRGGRRHRVTPPVRARLRFDSPAGRG
jgi:hypothetical protein